LEAPPACQARRYSRDREEERQVEERSAEDMVVAEEE